MSACRGHVLLEVLWGSALEAPSLGCIAGVFTPVLQMGNQGTRGLSHLPQQGLCVPQSFSISLNGTHQQAFIGHLLNTGLLLASGVSGGESRQSWVPEKEVCRWPRTPSSLPPLGFSGSGLEGSQVGPTTFFLLKAGTKAVSAGNSSKLSCSDFRLLSAPWSVLRVNIKSNQTSNSLPICLCASPLPPHISASFLMGGRRHGSSGWYEGRGSQSRATLGSPLGSAVVCQDSGGLSHWR